MRNAPSNMSGAGRCNPILELPDPVKGIGKELQNQVQPMQAGNCPPPNFSTEKKNRHQHVDPKYDGKVSLSSILPEKKLHLDQILVDFTVTLLV